MMGWFECFLYTFRNNFHSVFMVVFFRLHSGFHSTWTTKLIWLRLDFINLFHGFMWHGHISVKCWLQFGAPIQFWIWCYHIIYIIVQLGFSRKGVMLVIENLGWELKHQSYGFIFKTQILFLVNKFLFSSFLLQNT